MYICKSNWVFLVLHVYWIKQSTCCVSLETLFGLSCTLCVNILQRAQLHYSMEKSLPSSQFSSEDEANFTLEDSSHLPNRASHRDSSFRKASLLTYAKRMTDKIT